MFHGLPVRTSRCGQEGEDELRYLRLLALLAVLCWSALAARVANASVPAFWLRLAHCETDSRWNWGAEHRAGEGSTFVGGLGIYEPNWDAWKVHVDVAGPAWSATPEEQARVAAWGWLHERAWWGCFSETGIPDARALVILRFATPRGRSGPLHELGASLLPRRGPAAERWW